MTVEDSKGGITQSDLESVTSDPEESVNSSRESESEEGQSYSEKSDDDAARLEEKSSEEQSRRLERKGATQQHGEIDDAYGEDAAREEQCPFCAYMKSGACGESFAEWEKCIDGAEKDGVSIAQKCFRVTRFLTQCMRANADYYGPILEVEKAMGMDVGRADNLEVAAEHGERIEREAVEVEAAKVAEESNG